MVNRRRARKIRLILFSGFLALLFGGLFWGIFYSPVFLINRVDTHIVGDTIDPNEVRAFSENWISGKKYAVFWKRHLFFYEPDELAPALSKEFMRIGELEIKPLVRERALRIQIRERTPFGFWCREPDDRCFIFDERGVLFEEIARPEGSIGIVVKDTIGPAGALGERVADPEWVLFLKELKAALQPEIWIKEYVIEPETFQAKFLRVKTTEGWDLLVNFEPDSTDKIANTVKEVLAKEVKGNRPSLEYLDLRVPGRAYYKLR